MVLTSREEEVGRPAARGKERRGKAAGHRKLQEVITCLGRSVITRRGQPDIAAAVHQSCQSL